MISCDVILDLLPVYADGQASDDTKALIQAHISECKTCADALKAMTVPMEQEPLEPDFTDVLILRKQRRKIKQRILLACIATALICIFSWWIYMETHFVYETNVVVSQSPEKILAEIPQLELTRAEKDFAEKLYEIPVLMDAIHGDELRVITWDTMRTDLASILPEGAELNEVSAFINAIYIDYQFEEYRYTLSYLDPNNDNTVDMIRKSIADGNAAGKGARRVYETEYLPILDMVSFEEQQLKHIWFGFLKMQ